MTQETTPQTAPVAASVTGCTFTGVHWDETAVEAVQTVASALLENAKALNALASVFSQQNIQIDSLLTVAQASDD